MKKSVLLLKNEPACWGWRDGRFHPMESFQAGQGFWLYALEDKSHKEIAGLLGISENTSASQLHRARTILARMIKEYKEKSR